MTFFNKLFGGLKMSWPAVILFAVAAGLYAGVMGSVPALNPTSFHDICVSHECWIIFAFIIATNCEKTWECALKTFVFFLISQPLVYGVEVLTGNLVLEKAIYYYVEIWGPATLFTLPGGAIAHLIKKQNPLGAIVLGLGNTLMAVLGCSYAIKLVENPPYHLLTVLLCFAAIVVMTLAIQKQKKNRIISFATIVVVFAALMILLAATGRVLA